MMVLIKINKISPTRVYVDFEGSAFTNFTDYQGNIRAVARGNEIVENIDYYPYGLPMASAPGWASRRRFGSKEFEDHHGLDSYNFEARTQLPTLGLFTRPDDKAGFYPFQNPYLYCAANPIANVDPTGREVIAHDDASKRTILNTLPKCDRKYVEFNSEGLINIGKLITHKSDSFNFKSLKKMAESKICTNVYSNKSYYYKDNDGNINLGEMGPIEYDDYYKEENPTSPTNPVTGETGFYGKTLLPGKGISGQNSPDEEIHVIINSELSPQGSAQAFSHEGYGHAYVYIITGNRKSSGHDYDGMRDKNTILISRIIISILETLENLTTLE